MIQHSLTRRRGGARVTLADFARWRDLVAQGSPATLPQVAVDAMIDPDGVTGVVDVTFELESNRNGRAVTTTTVPAALGLLDTTNMDLADLGSGRRRPSQNVCVADASYADASSVWPSSGAAAVDEYPVGVASATYRSNLCTVRRPAAVASPNVDGWFAQENGTGAPTATVSAIDPSDAGRLTVAAEGLLYKVLFPGPTSTQWAIYVGGSNPGGSYHIGPDGTRTFTIVAKVAVSAAVTITPRVQSTIGGLTIWNGIPVNVAPSGAAPNMPLQRVVFTVVATGTPGALATVTLPRFRFDVNGLGTTRVEFADVQMYAGTEQRSDAAGLMTGAPGTAFGFEQQFTGTRRFNRLDVTGHEGSIPSAVYVEQWTGAAWAALAVGSATIVFAAPVVTTGLRVYIEETVGYGGAILLNEIDASYVAQLDGETTGGIVAASATWARESDPGQVASPFGNYQTSTLDLELDNSAGVWSPEANENLDVGHRITAAFGVRYTNLCPNPRADVDVTGWTLDVAAGASLARTNLPAELTANPPGGVATAIAIRMPATTASVAYVYSEFYPAAPGDVFDLAAFVRLVMADPAAAGVAVAAITFHSSTTVRNTSILQRTNVTIAAGGLGSGWIYGFAQATAPASTVAVRVEFSGVPQASPGANAFLTRVRLRKVEAGIPVQWETLLPAGVFYSDPFDFSSDDATVSISATDALGRRADVALTDSVRISQTVGAIVNDLATSVLDLGTDQVAVGSNVASYLIPYAMPASNAGGYFADLAKCVAGSLYVDALERLVLTRRDFTTAARVAEVRSDNALIRYRRPAGYDLTTSAVMVTASPTIPDKNGVSEVWAMPPGGFQVPATSTKTIVADYSAGSGSVIAPFLSGAVADLCRYTHTPTLYTDPATIDVVNPNGTTLTLADLRIQGTLLVQSDLTTLATDVASVKRYGNRTLEIEARLVQTQAQLDTVSQVLLDAFKALDVFGNRRLPDLILDGMGLPHLEGGDRILVTNPRTGLGEDFAVLSRRIGFAGAGELLMSDVRVRQSPDVIFMIADIHLADDISVAGA